MAKERGPRKPHYAAVPLRAIGDPKITDGDLRVLCSIAAFDRLSHARGTGQGAWATHRLMAGWCRRDYTRFSVSVSKLLREGYIVREKRATNRTQYTYRIVYTDEDRLPSSKDDVCQAANDAGEIVCRDAENASQTVCPADKPSPENNSENTSQYISQREEIYSVETGKINSAKQRGLSFDDFGDDGFSDQTEAPSGDVEGAWQDGVQTQDSAPAVVDLFKDIECGMTVGAALAQYERRLKAQPASMKLDECLVQLSKLQDDFEGDNQTRGQIERLLDATWEKHVERQRADAYGGRPS
ncbi:hypothetical protein [Sphingobium estronivorans]|uniref:hypothetical protein n=1 Tax=Sphingobium estronivorans TaxID=1577690 RepID=UPI001239097C|nr:hypothetical protein [Sphingobium estronivorans]